MSHLRKLIAVIKSRGHITEYRERKLTELALDLAMDQLTETQQRNVVAGVMRDQRKNWQETEAFNRANREAMNSMIKESAA